MRQSVIIILLILLGEVIVTSFTALITAKVVRIKRGDNAYTRYIRTMLIGIGINNILTGLGLIIVFAQVPDYQLINSTMRVFGLAIEGVTIILFCLFLLGVINGIGWFAKGKDSEVTGPLPGLSNSPEKEQGNNGES